MSFMSSTAAAMAMRFRIDFRRSARFGKIRRTGEGSVNVLLSPMSARHNPLKY